MDWLIGKHSHLAWHTISRLTQGRKSLCYSFTNVGVIELVRSVVRQEIIQSFFQISMVPGIAQCSLHQHGCTIAYVGRDHFRRKLRPVEVAQHGIYRVHEIKPGIDQSAVEVKDQQLDGLRVELPVELDHFAFRINDAGATPNAVFPILHLAFTIHG